MNLSRIVVFLFASSFFLCASCTRSMLVQVTKNDYTSLPALIQDSQQPLKFKTTLKIYEVSLTGIMVTKMISDEYRISFMNEFGVKYFDARISETDAEMLYCVKQLDKKILSNVLLHDLAVMLLPSSGKSITEDTFTLGKFNYKYIQEDGLFKQIQEYKKNKVVSTFSKTGGGEIGVEHTQPRMSLILKPI